MISRNLYRTDLNLFVVFATIFQERSLTRAAEVLHVTQPAVSASLSKLRELFDDPLFVRCHHGVKPTNLAQTLIEPVRDGLQALEITFQEAEQFNPTTSARTFNFSVGDLAEVLFLTPLVSAIHNKSSKISVRNRHAPDNEVNTKLAKGEIDFAIEFFDIDMTNLKRTLLLSDEFVCVLRKNHPALKSQWNLETYLSLDHLHISNRTKGPGFVDRALEQLDHNRHIPVQVQHCLVGFHMLKQSDLCLTIPREFVNHCLGSKSFEMRPAPFPIPVLELWLYWHEMTNPSLAHQWVRDLITSPLASQARGFAFE